jgi:chemotaxis protein MotA
MYNLLGFILSIFFIRAALQSLNVNTEFFLDEVALLIVLGGTFAVMVISFPAQFLIKFISAPYQMLRSKRPNSIYSVEILVRAAMQKQGRKSFLKKSMKDPKVDPFLKEGMELFLMDLSLDDFKNIMTERIYRSRQREEEPVNLFRRLAKYPPAFGLVGTVLGLISLMRSVGEGANASVIGLNMALALTATLYGLAFANFILAPIAENFQQRAEDNKIFRELLLEGLLMIHDDDESLAVQEMLNSYLDPRQRVDVLGVHRQESA